MDIVQSKENNVSRVSIPSSGDVRIIKSIMVFLFWKSACDIYNNRSIESKVELKKKINK